jgi:DNA-binding transcriptional LysR family regulator
MDILALSDFNLVASHGGFGRASRASGQPKATLSRRIRELEQSLGVRLIERGGRQLRLTEEGAVLHARTEQSLGEIGEALADARAGLGRPSGRLRVSVPVLFAQNAMGRIAAAFAAAYPAVLLEVTTEDRFAELVEEGYDVVLRVNPRPDDALVGRRFLTDRIVLAAPAGMARPEGPVLPAVMRVGTPDDAAWRVVEDGQETVYRPKPVLRLSTPLMVRDALRAGAGAALVPVSAVAADLAEGRLVSWGEAVDGEIEAWVLHASRRLVSPKVSAFVNFLCSYFPEGRF